MEKFKYTEVHLRSGKTALVGGTEWEPVEGILIVYPDKEGAEPVRFNWDNVEMFRVTEIDLPDEAEAPPVAAADPIKDADLHKFLNDGYL